MSRRSTSGLSLRVSLLLVLIVVGAGARAAPNTAAILAFDSRGERVASLAPKVADVLFAELIGRPGISLLEREQLQSMLAEAELGLSGMVRPDQAVQVGRMSGAQILVTGRILAVDDRMYLVAKVIGTGTSRVKGAKAIGPIDGELGPLVARLADRIADVIREDSAELVPEQRERGDFIAAMRAEFGVAERPLVTVDVSERHIGARSFHPSSETEIKRYLDAVGFEVVATDHPRADQATFAVSGRGQSQFLTRTGDIVSTKARLELQARARASGRVLTSDRGIAVEVDLVEELAAKKAFRRAAQQVARTLIRDLVSAQAEAP